MLKWLINRAPATAGPLRHVFLPMPERLLEISSASARKPHVASSDVDEFSTIISSLWINQTNKRTARGRLPETLQAISRALPPASQCLRFLDLGASDAVSTYDAVCYFRDERGIPITAHAVDLYTQLHRYDGRFLSEYRTSDGSPVLVRVGRLGLRLGRPLAFRPFEMLRNAYLRTHSVRDRLCDVLAIPLIHPLAAADPDVTVAEADALLDRPEFHDAFNVVRICNLLNRSYFSAAQMETIVGHAVSYLEIGGLLVVSRNETGDDETTERGTVWRREQQGLTWQSDFNGGSELRGLIARFEATQVAEPARIAA